jgi:hypothetical protein
MASTTAERRLTMLLGQCLPVPRLPLEPDMRKPASVHAGLGELLSASSSKALPHARSLAFSANSLAQ